MTNKYNKLNCTQGIIPINKRNIREHIKSIGPVLGSSKLYNVGKRIKLSDIIKRF